MSKDKISVIVPAYNCAAWLPRCLDSLLAQTYLNMEIIVVDDGSSDNTWEVLGAYSARDSRVRAICKENGGVTSARLLGVSEAEGDWIGFVDADDEVEPQMYERLVHNAKVYGADISHCGYQVITQDGTVQYLHNTGMLRQQDRRTGIVDLLESRFVEPGLCSKLFRKELLRDLEQKMDPEIKNFEDLLMNYYLFSKAEKSILEDVCPYHYLLRSGSASRRKPTQHTIYDPIRVHQIILEDCPEGIKADARRALVQMCLVVYGQLTLEKRGEYAEDLDRVRQRIIQQKPFLDVIPKRNALLVQMIAAAPWMFHLLYNVYVKLFGRTV